MSTITIPGFSLILRARGSPTLDLVYKYTPLPVNGWTRILLLHPASTGDSLSCSLQAWKIEDIACLGFEALSYVWGSENGDQRGRKISCDGATLHIRENLACALNHLRHERNTRFLWVDAVCINQEDQGERAQQVQQMGQIYASASRVLVWLAPDINQEAKECFSLIQDTATLLAELVSRYGDVSLFPPIAPESGKICLDPRKWDMVRRLMDSEWFSRVWVLQEVGLARSAVLLYGNATMNWAYLVELMLIVASRVDVASHTGSVKSGMLWDLFDDLWRTYGNDISWRNELPMCKMLSSNKSEVSFINILNDGRSYMATDPRDRVYAFLSHPSTACGVAQDKRMVVANYNLSVDEVYFQTAEGILDNDPYPWTVLTCVDHTADPLSLYGRRPSWVPRWDEGWRVYWLGYPEMWYRAGGIKPASFQFEVSRSESALRVTGVILDSIEWTSRVFDSQELLLEAQRKEAPLQKLWQELESDRCNAIYGSSQLEREHAYSLTTAAGRAADEGPAEDNPRLHRAIYRAYKKIVRGPNSSDHGMDPLSSTETDSKCQEGEESPRSLELEALTYIGSNQRRAFHNRRFFRTKKGYYGIGHLTVKTGDECCVFRGANVPFVIRRVSRDNGREGSTSNQHLLVGESYIQGVMRGEIFEMMNAGGGNDLNEETIILV
ncbi:uncharacterized protein Z520_03735 [Fonsecaea multimorphosa CBS 102226]|uniref:Heterokaryon incompatibility domain-containing protein n=1 Tax=Fonsecaea multimorphosa CBS 102226 TaxID=1442371 RepID=A0A0D2KWA3_9EURO|nr:uncharacterized protein Z520_03735 [Fonsecaea multimorphosa CBS 102226]KIY01069.1 hypothetical protein Z520_03735 [Fonsecaea multimorphosa CBS 102226]OAL21326.1 hypothetical protein AYO22_08049 [Fonsecaea multimorphosa]